MHEAQIPADEPAHDVLAAEEFAMPAPDPNLHHGPVILPEDPTGIVEPHDVLAAEEFAMPAPAPRPSIASITRRRDRRVVIGGSALALATYAWFARRRS